MQDLNNMDFVVCDCCIQWVHLKCFGFAETVIPEMLKIFRNFYSSFNN